MTEGIEESSGSGYSPEPRVVVVGASAGGIEALSTLVSGLTPDFPAPMVIAQHLDPSRESHLKDILARKSAIPVRTVTEHEPLEPGVIFVVPANRHVNITDSEITFQVESGRQPKPSVDLLLSSAAEAVGERLIAVILTGTGKDGAAGAAAVKKAGGTVIIQNPETAEYPGMPQSLAPSTVDIVAELDELGGVLQDLLSGIAAPATGEKDSLEELLEDVRELHGVDFSGYKTPTILRRLKSRIVATGAADIEGYSRYLLGHPEEYQKLINSLLIKVTEFFRDADLFEHLRDEIMPRLIEEARVRGNELRLWSAGCATGEEAYSLAIMVAEALGDEISRFKVRIFATDVDDGAVGFARTGVYSRQAIANVPEDLLERYFEAIDGEYRVNNRIRSIVVFGKHDLGQRAPFPRIDLVLSRNVLIYFTAELQRRALDLFAHSLRDGGRLVLGKAESVSTRAEYFEPGNREQKVFYRRGERFILPAPPRSTASPAPSTWTTSARAKPEPYGAGVSPDVIRGPASDALRDLPVGVVIVDSRYDISFINAAAQRMLSIYSPAIGEDLIHLLQGSAYTQLRPAIDAAFTEQDAIEVEDFVAESLDSGEPHYLRLVVYPHVPGARGAATFGPGSDEIEAGDTDRPPALASAESVMITIGDVSALGRERDDLNERLQSSEAELKRVSAINQRLADKGRQLEKGNRELSRINQDIQASNEELSLSSEEAQAATEEVETLNEELQATNEELETLNEELQATIEELNTTTDDQQARGRELQEESQDGLRRQRWLHSILESLDLALIVMDSSGAVMLRTTEYEKMLGEAAPGFLDADAAPVSDEASPVSKAARGERFVERYLISTGGGYRRYEASGWPLDEIGAQSGGAVVIRDLGAAETEG